CFDTGTIRLFAPCTTSCYEQGQYQLAIALQSNPKSSASAEDVGAAGGFVGKAQSSDVAGTTSNPILYCTALDPEEESIRGLDQDGHVLSVMSPPEGPLGGLG